MIITVTTQKGGAGKTTLLVNLACLLQQELEKEDNKRPVAVLDLDGQESTELWIKAAGLPIEVRREGNLSQLRDEFSVVLVDTPGNLHDHATQEAIRVADLVVVPCQPSPQCIRPTQNTIGVLREICTSPAILVVTMFKEHTLVGRGADVWTQTMGLPVAIQKITYREIYQQVSTTGWVDSGEGHVELKALVLELFAFYNQAKQASQSKEAHV